MATTAELEERVAHRLEHAKRVTYRSFLWAGTAMVAIPMIGTASRVSDGEAAAGPAVAALVLLVPFAWNQRRLLLDGLDGVASRRDLLLGAALGTVLTLMMPLHETWVMAILVYAATAALSFRSAWSMGLLCLGTALIAAWSATAAEEPGVPLYPRPWLVAIFFAISVAIVWGNRYQVRIWYLHQEAHAAREALARLAVTEERLRFSRDLHDLLGHRLSLIAVKSELAMRLADGDPAAAREEMADVRSAAREALREVRSAVRGYRAADLDAELAGVRAVLEAAGIDCSIARPPSGLGPGAAGVLAWVVREGVTNVIKHSAARHCAITFTERDGALIVELTNDGVPTGAESGSEHGLEGSGLTGLRERLRAAGGTLSADPDGHGGFVLRATLPAAGRTGETPEPGPETKAAETGPAGGEMSEGAAGEGPR